MPAWSLTPMAHPSVWYTPSFWLAALRPELAACPMVAFCHVALGRGAPAGSVDAFILDGGPKARAGMMPCVASGCLWHLSPVTRSIRACSVHGFVLASRPRVIVPGHREYCCSAAHGCLTSATVMVPLPGEPTRVRVALRPPSCPILYVQAQCALAKGGPTLPPIFLAWRCGPAWRTRTGLQPSCLGALKNFQKSSM